VVVVSGGDGWLVMSRCNDGVEVVSGGGDGW